MSAFIRIKINKKLDDEERELIAMLYADGCGWSMRDIASALNRAPSTISRELQRNCTPDGSYNAPYACLLAEARRRTSASAPRCFRPKTSYRRFAFRHPGSHNLTAWYSDTNFYLRLGDCSRSHLTMFRRKSLFSLEEKPFHFRELIALAEFLVQDLAMKKDNAESLAIKNGEQPPPPPETTAQKQTPVIPIFLADTLGPNGSPDQYA